MTYESAKDLLLAARDRASSDPVRISIRELLGCFDARARGAVVVAKISAALSDSGLTSSPSFTKGYIDNHVTLVPAPAGAAAEPEDAFQEQFLRVHTLRSAHQDVAFVAPNQPIEQAQTLMALNDFSQLAVLASDRADPMVISWESIGRARLNGDPTEVRHAAAEAICVAPTANVLQVLSTIADRGFVFVRQHKKLVGLVTAADVTHEFGELASPFFLLGEIERRLRAAVDAEFQVGELRAVRNPSDSRDVQTSGDLSFGELQRVIQPVASWERLGWRLHRSTFLKRIDEVRLIRNSFMHFSSDLPSPDDIKKLKMTVEILRGLTPDTHVDSSDDPRKTT